MAPRRSPLALHPLMLVVLLGAVMATTMMPGGRMSVSISDPGVQEAARFALTAYNQASNSLYYSRTLRIVSAESQVSCCVQWGLRVPAGPSPKVSFLLPALTLLESMHFAS